MIWAVLAGILLVATDQLTKLWAVRSLAPIGQKELIPGFFHLVFVTNDGAAFNILRGNKIFLLGFVIVIVAGLCVYYVKLPKTKQYRLVRVAIVMIASGAVGNFIDRARQGYVVDFFYFVFIDFPVFNMADIYVVLGTLFLSFLLLFVIKEDKKLEPLDG